MKFLLIILLAGGGYYWWTQLRDPGMSSDMEQLIRDTIRAQNSIVVPHPLPDAVTTSGVRYENAVVYRLEPDGISVRHAHGITKIFYDEMQETWMDQYDITVPVAIEYRRRMARLQKEQEKEARQRNEAEKTHRLQALEEHGRSLSERERNRARARQQNAWARYDRDLAAWEQRRRDIHPQPAPPQQPPFPRP